jgi:outer membrane protein OmpA-like peptidoglycan-associated protein
MYRKKGGSDMSILKITGYCLTVLLFGQANVSAENVKMYTENVPSAAEMGNVLFATKPQTEIRVGRMRSFNFTSTQKSEQTLKEAAETNQQGAAIGLPIKFGFNSANILEESKPFLIEIGNMLRMQNFSSEKLMIEGHTDAGGPEEYNQGLSERRAESVKKFLKFNFSIDANRLYVTGMGEGHPLADINPYDAVNRRVQFRRAP